MPIDIVERLRDNKDCVGTWLDYSWETNPLCAEAADAIVTLRTENDATETACAAACAALVIELDNVRAERDALKLDAERYRRLRNPTDDSVVSQFECCGGSDIFRSR